MKLVRRTSMLVAATAAVFPLLGSTSADAACVLSGPNQAVRAFACTSGDCWVDVLGDRVFTCP